MSLRQHEGFHNSPLGVPGPFFSVANFVLAMMSNGSMLRTSRPLGWRPLDSKT